MSRHFGGLGHNRQLERARLLVILGILLLIVIVGGSLYLALFSSGKSASTTTTVVVQKEETPLRKVDVLVPLQKIEAGTELTPALFRVDQLPEVGLSSRVIRGYDEIKGYYARSMLVSGEPLVADLITAVRPTNALTAAIPEGFRAVTINVNATSSVEGYALPGAKVDVVWASKIRGQAGVTVIVQNAKVLSAERTQDPNAKPGAPVPSTVTLLVSADDATKIQLASTTGSLSLSLRGDSDPGKGTGGGSITVEDLLTGGKPVVNNGSKTTSGLRVKVRGADGKLEELVLDNGKLVRPTE